VQWQSAEASRLNELRISLSQKETITPWASHQICNA